MLSIFNKVRPSKSLLIQAGSAGALAMTGDVICQLAIEKAEKLDFQRALKFGLVVSCMAAPIQYKWFQMLEKRVNSNTKIKTGLKRMALDQIIAAPFLTSMFIFIIQMTNGQSVDRAAARTRSVIGPVLSTNYKVWPAVQFLNMSVIPLQYRVVFVQFVAIFWNIYLSSQLNSNAEK